jgi:hypothetical protein
MTDNLLLLLAALAALGVLLAVSAAVADRWYP